MLLGQFANISARKNYILWDIIPSYIAGTGMHVSEVVTHSCKGNGCTTIIIMSLYAIYNDIKLREHTITAYLHVAVQKQRVWSLSCIYLYLLGLLYI